jgi:hypothetical protein
MKAFNLGARWGGWSTPRRVESSSVRNEDVLHTVREARNILHTVKIREET